MESLPRGSLPNVISFCRAYERGNFTLAARDLRTTPAAVSRAVMRLEQALSVTLFRRTTRRITPTDQGRAYYERCAKALALLAEAERSMHEDTRAAVGVVRVSAPSTYGLSRLIPRLRGFTARHPGVRLELSISNVNVDFVSEGFDLAVRMGALSDAASGLVARSLGDHPLAIYASPGYVKKRGAPRSVEELGQHACIVFAMPRTGRLLPWLLASPSEELLVSPAVVVADDPVAGLGLAAAGEGLFQTYVFMAEAAMKRGELVPVLAGRAGRTRRFSLLWPRTPGLSPAARVVAEEIVKGARDGGVR
jgi:DNA-binding transcriptional LysR family regulator